MVVVNRRREGMGGGGGERKGMNPAIKLSPGIRVELLSVLIKQTYQHLDHYI